MHEKKFSIKKREEKEEIEKIEFEKEETNIEYKKENYDDFQSMVKEAKLSKEQLEIIFKFSKKHGGKLLIPQSKESLGELIFSAKIKNFFDPNFLMSSKKKRFLIFSNYHYISSSLPLSGTHIIAHFDHKFIVFFCAASESISDFCVRHGCFGGDEWSSDRYTFLKLNFSTFL